MNLRENVRAVLQYEPFDHMPVIHFGYWQETLEKWREEGHLTAREIENYYDGSPSDRLIARKLGFDYGWQPIVGVNTAPKRKSFQQNRLLKTLLKTLLFR